MPKTSLFLCALFVSLALGCGPNVLTARGTVMHPMFKDKDLEKEYAFIRVVTIVRKEPRVRAEHTIVGRYAAPLALGELRESAEIISQKTDGTGLYVEVEIYSIYKDELVNPRDHKFWLVTSDGKKVRGKFHRVWGLVNLSEKVTGGSLQTYQVVRDKKSGRARQLQAWKEVENDFQLYWRKFRVLFMAPDMISLDTKYVIFIVRGNQRERRYRFDFSLDPVKLLNIEEKRLE